MRAIDLSADELVSALLGLAGNEKVCILDSCGAGHLGSHLLIAGIRPVEIYEISGDSADEILAILDEKLASGNAAIFTISYDFGLKLEKINRRENFTDAASEPDVFVALFDLLVIHDYHLGESFIIGDEGRFGEFEAMLTDTRFTPEMIGPPLSIRSNFDREQYVSGVEKIKEYIRAGDTYQANLTQQLRVKLPHETTAEQIFRRLRRDHPAPFAAYLKRNGSTVVSASPERFIKVRTGSGSGRAFDCGLRTSDFGFATDKGSSFDPQSQIQNPKSKGTLTTASVSASPIKGTRPRGHTAQEDDKLRAELLNSEKDRAENVMIVDLVRNDLGRVCEFGTINVTGLCEIEEHPTLFHLTSTIEGKLLEGLLVSDIIRAVFPCGSITGAPKIRTMQILDEIENLDRGLSMGAIGVFVPSPESQVPNICENRDWGLRTRDLIFELSVAIRTMVIRDREAVFNVGGGVVIDSDPENEYEESLLKAKALLNAIGSEGNAFVSSTEV